MSRKRGRMPKGEVMKRFLMSAAITAAMLAGTAAAEPLKIGLVSTLSGPSAALGVHMRDGFMLGLKHAGGKLGGAETEVITVDDELKPDVGVAKVQALLERDKVDIVAGVVFSNVMGAVAKPVTDAEVFLISGNAGPSTLGRTRLQPVFLCGFLAERPDARGARQTRAGQGLQARVPDGAELPSRQGFAGRVQAPFQGRSGGRGLHAARPARLFRRTRRASPPPSPTRCSPSCRAAWA
jgi:hypothetical protein